MPMIKRGRYTDMKAHYCKYYLTLNSLDVSSEYCWLKRNNLKTPCNLAYMIQTQQYHIFPVCTALLPVRLSPLRLPLLCLRGPCWHPLTVCPRLWLWQSLPSPPRSHGRDSHPLRAPLRPGKRTKTQEKD